MTKHCSGWLAHGMSDLLLEPRNPRFPLSMLWPFKLGCQFHHWQETSKQRGKQLRWFCRINFFNSQSHKFVPYFLDCLLSGNQLAGGTNIAPAIEKALQWQENNLNPVWFWNVHGSLRMQSLSMSVKSHRPPTIAESQLSPVSARAIITSLMPDLKLCNIPCSGCVTSSIH